MMMNRNLLSTSILVMLFFSYTALAMGEETKTKYSAKKYVLDMHNALVTQKFHHKIEVYNKLARTPLKFADIEKNPTEREQLKIFYKDNQINALPKIKLKGEMAGFRVGKLVVKFSLVDIYQKQISINNHLYTVPIKSSFSAIREDLKRFLEKKKLVTKASRYLVDLFIDSAYAADDGFLLTLGAVMALAIEADRDNDVYDWGHGFFDNHDVEDALKIMKSVESNNRECQAQIPTYADPDPAYLVTFSPTTDLIYKLGYYSHEPERSQGQRQLKEMSRGLQDYLQKHQGPARNCEEMAISIFNLKDPDNNLLTNWLDRQGSSIGRMERRQQRRSFADAFCSNITELETCLARFGVPNLRIHGGDRSGKPQDGNSGSGTRSGSGGARQQ